MLFYTGLIFLVIAVSLDGFGVGITYGMRNIRVPLNALIIIMLCSGIIVLLSMTIGNMLTSILSPNIASMLGGSILIILGSFALFNCIVPRKELEETDTNQNILSTVLSTPGKADLDHSGVISPMEAILLGSALALDAFGAGIGASMLGYGAFLTAGLIAIMSGTFLFCGLKAGIWLAKSRQLQRMTFLPPLLLIALGITSLIH
ncbi:MAG: sporulation membrane protein YtaF [Bacillota bacterium]|uniref:Sporulation membrane protein YtaF n=1 Tax=Virgibacillus salarius TaxID=447199 RepID=A0A941DV45_9BACI|nr:MULTISPECIES: sporulation membrane protein YtaF [Bacillaceae]NAZ08624.1 sporulation membrane protein YtaF [Agaribacter marinus]MBR7795912.1 sporulation membrane protein YtaF [Virgibacillus salarius]MCC2251397.1 sporulation membrane protein YtaF [Virgibacillus sp. AGTR]MDY7042769.1 sporulation membrane protein YtaF [Virgibacillus sp. M23]QRZ18126.1 sporulation membrane protein YtaF [Virgibacillus sp. AGTR]